MSSQAFELTVTSPHGTRIMSPDEADELPTVDARLHNSTVRKLDFLLLPFLALLFLFNALDKSNVCE